LGASDTHFSVFSVSDKQKQSPTKDENQTFLKAEAETKNTVGEKMRNEFKV